MTTLNIASVYSAASTPGSVLYKTLQKNGGEDKELTKVAADKGVTADVAYVQKKIASATKVDDLLKDRKVMTFLLSAFGLESEQDTQAGLLKKVLTQDPTNSSSVANSLADARYLQMAKTLDFFHNGLTQLKQTNTSSSTFNLGVSGNNYFVVQDKSTTNTVERFTQSASFTVNSTGYLTTSSGLVLQGWSLDANGNRPAALDDFNTYDTSELLPVKINVLDNHFSPTTQVTTNVSLKSTSDASAGSQQFSEMATIYDNTGNAQKLNFEYTKQDTTDGSDKWSLKVYDQGTGTLLNGTDGTTLSFNSDGTLPADQQKLQIDGIHFFGNFSDSNITVDLSSATSKINTATTDSYSLPIKTDSVKLGAHTALDVDNTGVVTATYAGGQKIKLFQIATASFSNSAALLPSTTDKTILSQTGDAGSGTLTVRVPGTTAGTINTNATTATTKSVFDNLKSSYYRDIYETALGEQNSALREALYFKRNISSATSMYSVLGDKVLRDVVGTSYNIPKQIAVQDVESQAETYSKYFDIKKVSSSTYVDKVINTYLAQSDSSSTNNSANSYTLDLLSSSTSTGIDSTLIGKLMNSKI